MPDNHAEPDEIEVKSAPVSFVRRLCRKTAFDRKHKLEYNQIAGYKPRVHERIGGENADELDYDDGD